MSGDQKSFKSLEFQEPIECGIFDVKYKENPNETEQVKKYLFELPTEIGVHGTFNFPPGSYKMIAEQNLIVPPKIGQLKDGSSCRLTGLTGVNAEGRYTIERELSKNNIATTL